MYTWTKWPCWQDVFMLRFKNMVIHSPRLTWLQLLLDATSAITRDQNWAPDVAPFTEVTSQQYIGELLPWEKKTFCSYWSRYLFWLCICLSYTWSFWPNYNLWPYKVTYPLSWYSTQYVFWPRNTFHTQRIATAGPHDHGIHWSYHVLHHPKAAGQIEIWNGLLKTQLQCQLSSSSLEGWGRVLQKTVYTLSQHPV